MLFAKIKVPTLCIAQFHCKPGKRQIYEVNAFSTSYPLLKLVWSLETPSSAHRIACALCVNETGSIHQLLKDGGWNVPDAGMDFGQGYWHLLDSLLPSPLDSGAQQQYSLQIIYDHWATLALALLPGKVFQYFVLFSFLKWCRTELDPSFIHISINSKGCRKTSVKMSWQTRADTPGKGSLRWYWASISLCTVSSLRQHEITSSRIDWISCPLSLGSSKHFYLHSLWTHESK